VSDSLGDVVAFGPVAAPGGSLVRYRPMPRIRLIAALAACTLFAGVLTGCVGAPSGGDSAQSGGGVPSVTTETPQGGDATPTVETTASVVVRMTTTKGDVTIGLFGSKAPATVANFVKLVEAHFYDGILIHRVEPGFVVQAGDPLTKGLTAKALSTDPRIGSGGPGWTIPLERNDLVHDRGVIAMARTSEPDSAGSQFYITLAPAHFLDGEYAVFGAVTSGMDVVDKLAVGDAIRSITIISQ